MKSGVLVALFFAAALIAFSSAASAHYALMQSTAQNILQQIIQFFENLFKIFSPSTTTTTSSATTSTYHTTITSVPTTATTGPSTSTASLSTTIYESTLCTSTTTQTTSTSTSTYTASTSTIAPTTSYSTTTIVYSNATIQCKAGAFLRVNQSLTCSPVRLYLVDVGQGNTQYEIANVSVDIYLNNVTQYTNQSFLQNETTPYQLTLSNGQALQIYVYQATYSTYPLHRSANITIVYR